MPEPADPNAPRFSDDEFALILQKASELQARRARASDDGYSVPEMQEIAREAGIAPALVAEAAAALAAERGVSGDAARGVPARPGKFRFESHVAGALTDEGRAELVDVARAHTSLPGQVGHELGALAWWATDGIGYTRVRVAPRAGGIKITVDEDRTGTLLLAWAGAGVAGLFAGAILTIVLRELGAARPAALLVGLGALLAITWAGGGAVWRRRAAAWSARVRALGEELTRAAREGVAREGAARDAPPGPNA